MDSGPRGSGLAGRRAQCRVLDGLLEAVRAGDSRVLVVPGEPGVGNPSGEAAMAANSVSQEVLEALVDEHGVRGVGAAAREMAPYAWNDAQLGVGHAFDLPRVVLRREVEVLLGGHHDRVRPDGAE